jgi:hypothetical protein
MTRKKPRERLEKTLARVAREQGLDQERCAGGFRSLPSVVHLIRLFKPVSSLATTLKVA